MINRPSAAIALLLTALGTAGCPISTGDCGDMSFEDREFISEYPLDADGMASVYYSDDPVDPMTGEGCEQLCEAAAFATLSAISSCEATVLIEPGEGSSDTADTGIGDGGLVEITCVASGEDICVGGRHAGTLAQRAQGCGEDGVSAWLAREACGEAGSVHAFRQLVRELRHHGAPAHLVEAARAAAADEVRHARMVRRLAHSRGGTPGPVRVVSGPARDLLSVAVENAVEGCVHETFAAARAGWQSLHAEDAAVRAVSGVLAEDEGRHADLAAAVHAWVLSVLPPHQAAQVEDARREAWARLVTAHPAADAHTARTLGLPTPRQHAALAAGLAAALAA